MVKFYVRQGMIVDKVHEIVPFKQSKCLEKYISFNTQKRNKAENDFEKDFYKLLNNAFYGETMGNVRNRLRLDLIEKHEYKEIIEQKSKIIFNGIHKTYEDCDNFILKKN